MTFAHYLLLMAAVHLAPNLNPWVRNAIGGFFMIGAVIQLLLERV